MLTRRTLFKGALAAACSVAAHPLITPVAFAEVASENRLVVIILRGAMDGLDIVRPVEDPLFAQYRPDLAKGPHGIDLGGGFALHPGWNKLEPLWKKGELGFAHAVSTPYRDKRSHFEGQDILEAGTPGAPIQDGWLNRLVARMPGATGETAYAVGNDTRLILRGPAPHGTWQPGMDLNLSRQARDLLQAVYRDDPRFAAAAVSAMNLSDELRLESAPEPASPVEAVAAFAADRLNRRARIAAFSVTGWDTHAGQAAAIRTPMNDLQAAILRLRATLGPVWATTAVLAMTEFGRTARQNGSGGTDHGTAGAMLFAGGAIAGGSVVGRWPGLADLYADRDLMPTEDVRAYAASAIEGLFGVERGVLEAEIFPGLDMSAVPRIVR
jgi:uncharacterized protein (DUF1501 family)